MPEKSAKAQPIDHAKRIAQLEAEVVHHQVVEQQLVLAKRHLDREIDRFLSIQRFVQSAAVVHDIGAFYQLAVETTIEAFEFEVAFIARTQDEALRVVTSFGFEEDITGQSLELPSRFIQTSDCQILSSGHPILEAWKPLQLAEVIICPFGDKDGPATGVFVGGISQQMTDYFEPPKDELKSSFEVLVRQVAALLANQELGREVRQHNEELRALAKSFSRFVPFEFLQLLGRDNIQSVKPADNTSIELTVLFADLRNFTALSEALGPEATFAALNEYLDVMQPPVSANGGFINHYQGDALMALFGGVPDTALAAAVHMVKALKELNDERAARGDERLRIGIGINSGRLILGAIGGEERLDSNVIGDAANLASRAEGLTKLYGATCILTDHTYRKLESRSQSAIRELDYVVVRGRQQPVAVYEFLDAEPTAMRQGKLDSAPMFAQALSMYRSGKFAAAIGLFAQCAEACPEDAASKLFVQRCAELVQTAPGPEWKGITVIDG